VTIAFGGSNVVFAVAIWIPFEAHAPNTLLAPGAPFVQFTYAIVSPIPRAYSGAHSQASERIWLNIPPARVWIYRKA